METHIPESNIGYKLLQRMGWKAGQGLGANGKGRVDPIRIELKDDVIGVGKAQEEETYHVSSTAKRKALGSEKQLEETAEERANREIKVEKQQMIAQELKEVKRVFYCELCDKQYNKVAEYEQHLQSYDHHHKKRFKDMKERTRKSDIAISAKDKIREKERKREERELKRIQEMIMQRTGGFTSTRDQSSAIPAARPSSASCGSGGGGGWVTVGEELAAHTPRISNTGDRIPKLTAPSATTVATSQNTVSANSSSTADTTAVEPKREQRKFTFGAPKKATPFRFELKKKK
ncbi:G-patch domain-containing protein [Dichotomocladium elegans]|nr:G-patch domain-containing protein [Dichotomocladium elegans]